MADSEPKSGTDPAPPAKHKGTKFGRWLEKHEWYVGIGVAIVGVVIAWLTLRAERNGGGGGPTAEAPAPAPAPAQGAAGGGGSGGGGGSAALTWLRQQLQQLQSAQAAAAGQSATVQGEISQLQSTVSGLAADAAAAAKEAPPAPPPAASGPAESTAPPAPAPKVVDGLVHAAASTANDVAAAVGLAAKQTTARPIAVSPAASALNLDKGQTATPGSNNGTPGVWIAPAPGAPPGSGFFAPIGSTAWAAATGNKAYT